MILRAVAKEKMKAALLAALRSSPARRRCCSNGACFVNENGGGDLGGRRAPPFRIFLPKPKPPTHRRCRPRRGFLNWGGTVGCPPNRWQTVEMILRAVAKEKNES